MANSFELAHLKDVRVYNITESLNLKLEENFWLHEFQCKDWPVVLVHPNLPRLLQAIRNKTDASVHINSAYRTPEHNAREGGSQNSRHMYGFAADIVSEKYEPEEIYQIAHKLQAGGVGKYTTFTHVDVWGMGRRF